MGSDIAAAMQELNDVVEQLRAPGGCPWDREQTHNSLKPYLLEETYEVLETIDDAAQQDLCEELGDLLLQVLMHCAIEAEADDGFDLGEVARRVRIKLVQRHPHVFADVHVDDAADVTLNWERLKSHHNPARRSVLDGVPRTMPALAYALAAQRRPARLGFDQVPELSDAFDDVHRRLDDVKTLSEQRPLPPNKRGGDWTLPDVEAESPATTEKQIGALLFSVVGLARRLRINPEDALRQHTNEFIARFKSIENDVRQEGADIRAVTEAEWQRRWDAV